MDKSMDDRIEKAQFSACKTCDLKLCDCGRSFYEKLKIIDELMGAVESDNSTIVDKIQGGFLYVCALFALTVNKVVDYIADAFRAAYKDGRL